MAFEDLQTEITGLFNTMGDRPEDIHELAVLIREKLNELKATGMPLPDDLVVLEAELDALENAPDAPDPETVRPSPEAEVQHDPLLESPGPPPE